MIRERVCEIEFALTEKGYAFFDEQKPYNVNVIGERTSNELTNRFDDKLHLIYRDDHLDWKHHIWPITTQPGDDYMTDPLNDKGTAILVPDQYRSAFGIGKHQGKYDALCQKWGIVRVYRDNNRDNDYDLIAETIEGGWFGINIHRSNPRDESYFIDRWSAGCQVFKRVTDFNKFMEILYISQARFGDQFTYTLVESKDMPEIDR